MNLGQFVVYVEGVKRMTIVSTACKWWPEKSKQAGEPPPYTFRQNVLTSL